MRDNTTIELAGLTVTASTEAVVEAVVDALNEGPVANDLEYLASLALERVLTGDETPHKTLEEWTENTAESEWAFTEGGVTKVPCGCGEYAVLVPDQPEAIDVVCPECGNHFGEGSAADEPCPCRHDHSVEAALDEVLDEGAGDADVFGSYRAGAERMAERWRAHGDQTQAESDGKEPDWLGVSREGDRKKREATIHDGFAGEDDYVLVSAHIEEGADRREASASVLGAISAADGVDSATTSVVIDAPEDAVPALVPGYTPPYLLEVDEDADAEELREQLERVPAEDTSYRRPGSGSTGPLTTNLTGDLFPNDQGPLLWCSDGPRLLLADGSVVRSELTGPNGVRMMANRVYDDSAVYGHDADDRKAVLRFEEDGTAVRDVDAVHDAWVRFFAGDPPHVCSECDHDLGTLRYTMVGNDETHRVRYCPGCGAPVTEALG